LEGGRSYCQGDPGAFGISGLAGIKKVSAGVLVQRYFIPLLQSRKISVEHLGMF